MSSAVEMDLSPEPDLHPLYPSTVHIAVLLSSHSGLAPDQKAELVRHCITRACHFGELSVLQYLISDPHANAYVDLSARDDDGVGLVSLTIHGFGAESDRDVEREECVRLLVSQGADLSADLAGWTPLHHAALLSPPTLISYLMTHGCSIFDVTNRNLTPLDIVTAHSVLPGRDDVALLLEEAMRGEGWEGGRMEAKRRELDIRRKRRGKRRNIRNDVGKVLGVNPKWWGPDEDYSSSESESELDEELPDTLFTPPVDYTSMLVFSPASLPHIFESIITNYQPSFRDATPANTLYMLARFACLTCDHNWLEDVIIGATDIIEDTFFNRAEDVTCLVFWLYNCTILLHLLQCDQSMQEACDMLGSFELIEEVINSVFVFIIRFAERKIDQMLDHAFLDFSSLGPEFDSIEFESSWSFLRPFAGKGKAASISPGSTRGFQNVPPSPVLNGSTSPKLGNNSFSSLRQSFARSRAHSSSAPLHSLFPDSPSPPSPTDVTSFLTALHTLLTLSDVNPMLTTQLWSQVLYWTSCEVFNRVLTRKKYLCRSKAIQIAVNLGILEEWVVQMGLPKGVQSHFNPVRDLLNWLQCLSSITEFPNLVATIQKMKNINPLQMRRAVRDYKYEINEGRMTEECVQYLTQLQKDWERHRVKIGVEALRKEMVERDRDRDSISSFNDTGAPIASSTLSVSSSDGSISSSQSNIDLLLEGGSDVTAWEPAKPPQPLGELLDSRHMLPLLFPSDPKLLSVLPRKLLSFDDERKASPTQTPTSVRSDSRVSNQSHLPWRSRNRKLREVGVGALKWVDGTSYSRWIRPLDEEEMGDSRFMSDSDEPGPELKINTHSTPLTRKPSGRSKGRQSQGGEATPVD